LQLEPKLMTGDSVF